MSKMASYSYSMIVLVLLLCAALTRSARPTPEPQETSIATTAVGGEADDDLCDGVGDEEYCKLMRRELADAHLDYIYTQKTKT
ncbi:unnamed protein product [Rhodiola kirilowii]